MVQSTLDFDSMTQKQINQMSEHSNGEIDLKEFVKVFQQNEINKSNNSSTPSLISFKASFKYK